MSARILLVEDNPGDARLVGEALRAANVEHELVLAEDGDVALEWLESHPSELPRLVLLDLNLARVGGREVLTRIRADRRWRALKVVVLSSSVAERDVRNSLELGADAYVGKPVRLTEYFEAVEGIARRWLAPDG